MALLFQPLTIKSIQLKNRIVVSPMCQYSGQDGFSNDWHLVHLGSRAVGGAGLVMSEACAVSPDGRISQGDIGIWKDAHIDNLKRITQFIEAQGSVAGIQLAHAGRKASCAEPWNGGEQLTLEEGGWQTVSASAVAFKEGTRAPIALSEASISEIAADFKAAANRALQAGFKVLELHAAHGYLIHQFFSPLTNFRTDAYGGSFENRIRILLDIVKAVQEVWPKDLPLFVRISATDWVEGGWSITDAVKLSSILKDKGVDLIDCSSGGLVAYAKVPVAPGFQVPFANQIKEQAGILTGAVGCITDPQEAEDILLREEADLIFLARELLRNPYFPMAAAIELSEDIIWPVQYERARKK